MIILLCFALLILIVWKDLKALGVGQLLLAPDKPDHTYINIHRSFICSSWHKKCFVLFFSLILYGLSTRQNTQDSGKKKERKKKELLFKGFFAVASTGKLVLAALAFVITQLQEENPVIPPLEWPKGGWSVFGTPHNHSLHEQLKKGPS